MSLFTLSLNRRPPSLLVSARLPFKRLNLVSKEKTDDGLDDMGGAQGAPVQGHVPGLETSLDHLEDSCHMGSDIDFRPKLVNGKGPLDNFLRSQVETSIGQTVVIIDLTEDSSDPPDGTMGHDKLNSAASPSQENVNGVTDEAGDDRGLPMVSQKDELAFPEEALSDLPCKTEAGDAERRGLSQKGSPQSLPELTGGLRTCSEKDQDGWSGARGILFKGKVPVVVLQDILAARTRAKSPPATPPGQAVPSESEALESSPEEDSVLSHSSLSSSSPTSSPEGQSAPAKQHSSPSPLPASTPVRRVSISPESVPSESRGFWVRPLPLHPGTLCPSDGSWPSKWRQRPSPMTFRHQKPLGCLVVCTLRCADDSVSRRCVGAILVALFTPN